jgi:hypothetical protein
MGIDEESDEGMETDAFACRRVVVGGRAPELTHIWWILSARDK